jgi:hypothetical protein
MEIHIIILALFVGFAFGLIGVGYLLRFQIPISLFVFIAGAMMASLFIMINTITIDSFLGGNVIDTVHYEVTTTTGLADICGGAGCNDIRGEHIATVNSMLIGDTIDCIDVTMRKSNAPTGNAIIGIFDHAQADSDPLIKQFGLQDVSVVSASNSQTFSYCLPDGEVYTLQFDDVIGVKFTGGAVGTTLRNQQSSIDVFDGINSITVTQDASTFVWSTVANSDFVAKTYLRGDSSEIINSTFGFTEEIKVFMVLMSVILFLAGAMVEFNTRRS